MKRSLSVLLVLVLSVSFAGTALADPEFSGSYLMRPKTPTGGGGGEHTGQALRFLLLSPAAANFPPPPSGVVRLD